MSKKKEQGLEIGKQVVSARLQYSLILAQICVKLQLVNHYLLDIPKTL